MHFVFLLYGSREEDFLTFNNVYRVIFAMYFVSFSLANYFTPSCIRPKMLCSRGIIKTLEYSQYLIRPLITRVEGAKIREWIFSCIHFYYVFTMLSDQWTPYPRTMNFTTVIEDFIDIIIMHLDFLQGLGVEKNF